MRDTALALWPGRWFLMCSLLPARLYLRGALLLGWEPAVLAAVRAEHGAEPGPGAQQCAALSPSQPCPHHPEGGTAIAAALQPPGPVQHLARACGTGVLPVRSHVGPMRLFYE